jgi:hypothetical protein
MRSSRVVAFEDRSHTCIVSFEDRTIVILSQKIHFLQSAIVPFERNPVFPLKGTRTSDLIT